MGRDPRMGHRVRHHLQSNVVGYIALFFALGLGTAWALDRDSVKSKHVRDESLKGKDIKDEKLTGADVTGLTGEDLDEATLGQVPSAADAGTLDGINSTGFLRVNGKAADANTLDGQDSSAFLGVNGKAADADALDGQDSSAFLGVNGKAADAQLLDGIESDDFARVSGIVNGSNGNPLSTGITSVRNGEGDYSVTIDDGTFANSGSSCSLLRPVVSPVGNEFHAAVWNEAGCTIGGGGKFDVLTFDAAGVAEDATFGFIVDVVP